MTQKWSLLFNLLLKFYFEDPEQLRVFTLANYRRRRHRESWRPCGRSFHPVSGFNAAADQWILLFSPPAGHQEVSIQCIFFFKASRAIQPFGVFLLLSPHNQFPLPAALCSLTLISTQRALCSAQKTPAHRRPFGGSTAVEAG